MRPLPTFTFIFARPALASLALAGALALSGGFAAGCSGERPPQSDDAGFLSDAPEARPPEGRPESGRSADGDSNGAPPGEGDGAGRAIVEADVIQSQGDTLFALSRFGGLSVVDLSDPARPRLRGRYVMTGVPFEMYVRGGLVYALFSSFGHFEVDGAGDSRWVKSSHVAALDASDPSHIEPLGEFDLPGEISDSRIVGDVLYAVTHEGGACWGCADEPNTAVTSLAIGDLANVRVVDRLRYESPRGSAGGGRRSVVVTPGRMYVAGVERSSEGEGRASGHSTVRVVDVSDPGGKLIEGAKVDVAGQIESRWQMDEYDGVLRVVSQPDARAAGTPPYLQTFRVESSQALVPLASKAMVLPRPERLRSVRFDGARAFALTSEPTAPLFALDFSDPNDPKQPGELEVPGRVYHMEVRGDRLYALGLDETAADGVLNVSLFDVADMAAPALLKRVNFGHDWGSFNELQGQVHKAFRLLPELGLALVPFGTYSRDEGGCLADGYQSGVQLVDIAGDDLVLRGVAPQRGVARRAFVHGGSLYAVSDEAVRSFSLADRDRPANVGELALSQKVDRTAAVGDKLVRLSVDSRTRAAELEVVPASTPGAETPLGSLDLTPLAGLNGNSCRLGAGSFAGAEIFAHADLAYLTWKGTLPTDDGTPAKASRHVAVVSLADPTRPTVVGSTAFPLGGYDEPGLPLDNTSGAFVYSGERVVALGTTLAFQLFDVPDGEGAPMRTRLALVDLSDPSAPRLASTLDVARGAHFTGLIARGTTLLSSHAEPAAGRPGKVRFLVDRVDASSPDAPRKLAPVNVPGSLLVAEGGRLVTVDYHRSIVPAADGDACLDGGHDYTYYNHQAGQCVRFERTFRLLDAPADRAAPLAAVAFPSSGYVHGVFVGEDRAFATVSPTYHGLVGYDGPRKVGNRERQAIFTLGNFRPGAGTFGGSLTAVSNPNPWWWSSLRGVAATGRRLVVTDFAAEPHVAVFDATDLNAPVFAERAKLHGPARGITVVGDDAVCSLGDFGVQTVPLAP
jgi:hypothetical protein